MFAIKVTDSMGNVKFLRKDLHYVSPSETPLALSNDFGANAAALRMALESTNCAVGGSQELWLRICQHYAPKAGNGKPMVQCEIFKPYVG
jgi:hypothetical protein